MAIKKGHAIQRCSHEIKHIKEDMSLHPKILAQVDTWKGRKITPPYDILAQVDTWKGRKVTPPSDTILAR